MKVDADETMPDMLFDLIRKVARTAKGDTVADRLRVLYKELCGKN